MEEAFASIADPGRLPERTEAFATAGAAAQQLGDAPGRLAVARRSQLGGEEPNVKLTHPHRVLYPGAGFTKRDLADFYAAVADVLLPAVAGRPVSLLRCPSGIGGDCFYQKHLGEHPPAGLGSVEIEERSGACELYALVETPAALAALAQFAALEIHSWGSRVEHLERPDRLIFDLDPGPGVGWPRVVEAARELRDLLAELGLDSFPRLTGGKGVHLLVPIEPEPPWERARQLARAVAERLAAAAAERYTVKASKDERPGKIFIDYLRNAFGTTAIASYSPRARPGAPVAVPIRWDELSPRRPAAHYDLRTVRRRLASLAGDPWEDDGWRAQRLSDELFERLGAAGAPNLG